MHTIKRIFLLLLFSSLITVCCANDAIICDTHNNIQIKEAQVQGSPKTSSIQASINGHALSVVFTENLGTVHVEVTDTSGGPVDLTDMYTPNGYNAYIHHAGSYVVTITLGNGDEYYGEFDVVD